MQPLASLNRRGNRRITMRVFGRLGSGGGPWIASPWARYGIALLLAVAGFIIRLALLPLLGPDTPILLSIVAVALAAWLAGFGPGVLATVISAIGAIVLYVPPLGHEAILSVTQVLRVLLFSLTGLVVSGLTEAWYRSASAWKRAEQEQENRVLQERNRMAREIHDTLAQGLTGIIIQLEAAQDMLADAPQAAMEHVVRAQDLARGSLTEARRSVQALRPLALEDADLATAIAQAAEQMTSGTGTRARVSVTGIAPDFLTADIQSNLLRIATEALTNALKHARADVVGIDLVYESDCVTLSVRDNGRGFVPHSPQTGAGFGLTGMWERAERIGGKFNLVSHRGEGTEVKVVVTNPAGAPMALS